jgi:hypothetical protein
MMGPPPAAPKALQFTPVPDPARDPNAFELGTVHLPVKATAAGETIASLQQRLVPSGYYDYRRDKPMGDKLLLNTIFDRAWDKATCMHKYSTLELLPYPEPEAPEPPPIPTPRVRKVTVVHYDGREAARTIGVNVENRCSPSQLAAAVGATLQPPLDTNLEQILIMQGSITNMYVNTYQLADNLQMGDGTFAYMRTWAFRVPKPKPKPSSTDAMPEYVIIFNHKSSPGSFDGRCELHPVVLPVASADCLYGGADANKAVADALVDAVRPYVRPGWFAANDAPFTLERQAYLYGEPNGAFCEPRNVPLSGSNVATLDAFWDVQQASMYNMAAFSDPVVDISASVDALRESKDRELVLRDRCVCCVLCAVCCVCVCVCVWLLLLRRQLKPPPPLRCPAGRCSSSSATRSHAPLYMS